MKLNLNVKYIMVLFVVFVVVFSIGISIFKYSKSIYVDSSKWDYNYSSSNVYISSDLLKNSDEVNDSYHMLSYDAAPIEFNVFNYESDTQISKMDLTYDLICTAPNGYECYIDGNQGGTQDNIIQKDYTCSIANLSAEECEENSNATVTYNKKGKSHTISVKSTTGDISTGSCTVNVSLRLKKPYFINLTADLDLTFNPDEQGIVVKLVKEYENKCVYSITNYSETNSFYFDINNNNDILGINYLNYIEKTINRYETLNNFVVYKNGEPHSCNNLLNVSIY